VNFNDDHYFTISPELLVVMARIVDDYPHELHNLIQKAQRSLHRATPEQQNGAPAPAPTDDPAYEQDSIIDFLSLMELLVYQTKHEVEVDSQLTKQLMPAIDHIDQKTCAQEIVASSVEHASAQKNKNPHVNAQELLYKELLRRWKPAKKTVMN
jgi:hypothetical protein